MFQITDAMRAAWEDKAEPKASDSEVTQIEQTFGITLPKSYVEFIKTHGYVIFGLDADNRRAFTYRVTAGAQVESRQASISFLHGAADILQAHRILTSDADPDDPSLPAFPADYLPIGNDAGQGQILLEMRPQLGRIWFWPEREWRWGTQDNTQLGFVADDFESFINGLRTWT